MGVTEWISDCGKDRLILGDCLERLRELPDCSVDSVVTDPPYGLAFMGKKWDYDVPAVEVWAECLRVLKPGGHLLAFAGTRTQHRIAVRIEDAGFEIRDMIAWVYGSGFPKSMNISKQLDKMAGAEREKKRVKPRPDTCGTMAGASDTRPWIERSREVGYHEVAGDTPITESARQWHGWGTALKPALEPITVARKPLAGTVAENVLQHGTGGINVDACRVGTEGGTCRDGKADKPNDAGWENMRGRGIATLSAGRWPANLIHDGSDEVVRLFPVTGPSAGLKGKAGSVKFTGNAYNNGEVYSNSQDLFGGYSDSGSAARFFYVPKASKADRDEGCEGLEFRTAGEMVDREEGSAGIQNPRAGAGRTGGGRNGHPTVKPCALMRYLCRLVTPPGGIVLDPFMGSGSTGKGAILEGFRFIGIEREAEYLEIAKARIAHATANYEPPKGKPAQLSLLPDQH